MSMRHSVSSKLAASLISILCIIAPGAWAQTVSPEVASPVSPGSESQAGGGQQGGSNAPQLSQHEKAEQELKKQEKQRILGVVPNFNTSNEQNAAPLSSGQKFRLAMRSAVDPFQFVAAGLSSGVNQAEGNFPGYGQGMQGYGKRFGAAYADQFDGTLWGNAILPSLLHEDPRYFRKGTGTFKQRLFYAASTTFICKRDNGTWGPNFANAAGNFIAGGISNLYYPSSDRGVGLTLQNAATVTVEGAAGAVFVEFWPDISRKLFPRRPKLTGVGEPAAK